MPKPLKDCKCLDNEDKKLLIQALNDAVGFNAFRARKSREQGTSSETERLTMRMRAFDELRYVVENTPMCK